MITKNYFITSLKLSLEISKVIEIGNFLKSSFSFKNDKPISITTESPVIYHPSITDCEKNMNSSSGTLIKELDPQINKQNIEQLGNDKKIGHVNVKTYDPRRKQVVKIIMIQGKIAERIFRSKDDDLNILSA